MAYSKLPCQISHVEHNPTFQISQATTEKETKIIYSMRSLLLKSDRSMITALHSNLVTQHHTTGPYIYLNVKKVILIKKFQSLGYILNSLNTIDLHRQCISAALSSDGRVYAGERFEIHFLETTRPTRRKKFNFDGGWGLIWQFGETSYMLSLLKLSASAHRSPNTCQEPQKTDPTL